MALPKEPTIFIKANSAISGPGDPITRPRGAVKLDYEVELVAVIGRAALHVEEGRAVSHVAVYCLMDDIADPQALGLWTTVNGERRQHGSTRDMVFPVRQLVSYLSRFMSLQPGDLLSTGTPAGVGHGARPPRYLDDGDVVAMGIDGLGTQQHRVIARRS
jgi:2-keto-4-pentenoate hydratase/2-oxohepta-3-ene-1,7-dioic acid hydratase in catechol pathway